MTIKVDLVRRVGKTASGREVPNPFCWVIVDGVAIGTVADDPGAPVMMRPEMQRSQLSEAELAAVREAIAQRDGKTCYDRKFKEAPQLETETEDDE